MSKLLAGWEKSKDFWFLLCVLFGFFLLRLPSLFEPYWYGDEGIYEVIGYGIRHGRMLYSGITDNKPPLLYLAYALFSGDQSPVRLLSLIFGLGAVITFFLLSKKLFPQKKAQYLTTGIFALLFALPLIEGNIANSENFMLFPILLAALIIISTLQNAGEKQHILKESMWFGISGLLLGIAFLFKIVAIFDLGAFCLFSLFFLYRKHASLIVSVIKVIPIGVGFAIPIVLTFAFFALNGILGTFFHFAFNSNVGYVNYGNQFIIPQGFLIIKLLLLGAFCLFVFLKRNVIPITAQFAGIWLAFSLFNAFFSQRPYTHYVLVVIAALALSVGLLVQKTKWQKPLLITFLCVVLLLLTNFNFYVKTIGYYGNFLSLMIGTKDIRSYQAFFDQNTPRDYDIAMFFEKNKKPGDTLFVWGDNGQIYKIINQLPPGRFIVAYHAAATKDTMSETRKALLKSPPRFIVIMPNKPTLPISLSNYSETIILQGAVIYAKNN